MIAARAEQEQKRGFELVAEALRDAGVDVVFGLMGEETASVVAALTRDARVRYVAARHETGAVAMANGYARLTGRVGVCVVSRGPGLTNSLTALTASRKGNVPLLVLTGDAPRDKRPHIKDISHDEILRPTGAESVRPSSGAMIRETVEDSLTSAASGRPVVLNLPTDLLAARVDGECAGRWGSRPVVRNPHAQAGSLRESEPEGYEASLDSLGQRLAGATLPMIIAGRGVVECGCGPTIRRLGERTGALLATTLLAKGLFNGDPFDVGVVGGFASPLAAELASSADCVVVFGASLSPPTTANGRLFKEAHVTQVDVSPSTGAASISVDEHIRGDARLVADALLVQLPASSRLGARTDEIRRRLASQDPRVFITDRSSDGALDPRLLMIELDRVLPRDRTLIVDGGHFCGFASQYLSVGDPRDFIFALDYGTMGLGVGLAVGAALSERKEATVLAVGDGGFMMALPDVETAVRYGLPIVFVVVNDQAFGAELHFLDMEGLPSQVARMHTPAFDEVARALGADGLAVRDWADIARVERAARKLRRPLVLDCRITTAVRADWIEEWQR